MTYHFLSATNSNKLLDYSNLHDIIITHRVIVQHALLGTRVNYFRPDDHSIMDVRYKCDLRSDLGCSVLNFKPAALISWTLPRARRPALCTLGKWYMYYVRDVNQTQVRRTIKYISNSSGERGKPRTK